MYFSRWKGNANQAVLQALYVTLCTRRRHTKWSFLLPARIGNIDARSREHTQVDGTFSATVRSLLGNQQHRVMEIGLEIGLNKTKTRNRFALDGTLSSIMTVKMSGIETVLQVGAPYPCYQGIKMCNKHLQHKTHFISWSVYSSNLLYFCNFCIFVILKYNIKEYIWCDELLCHLSDLPIVIILICAG